jgi:3-oxoacyl-[acyl-carrier-protein] synthase-3
MNAITGVALRAVAAATPARVVRTADYTYLNPDERKRFQKATGISERRIVAAGQCASDLCLTAAKAVLEHLGWDLASIGALILITQTGDQPVPATSIVLQDKLGLPQSCLAFDINLGCSSYPYGLAVVGSMIRTLGIARALLLVGDVSSRVCAEHDKSAWPLFGDAGSATALELDENAPPIHVDLCSDGAGKDAIIIPGGGLASRLPPVDGHLVDATGSDGVQRHAGNLVLRGADIFSFAISRVPGSIQRAMSASGRAAQDFDFLLLHQANKMINDTIARKLGFAPDRVPTSIEHYGNTSSASIPVTLCANAELFAMPRWVVASGFGVGLSWGSATFQLPAASVLPCIASDDVY